MRCVSTIIPAFNRGGVLPRAVESAYAQVGEFEADVIVVDDGSTDNTPAVCEALRQRFPNLCVIRQNNAGVSAARNAGIQVARGDFFHFLDSDDYMLPGMYSQMIAALGQSGDAADVAYCGYAVVDPAGRPITVTDGEPVAEDMRARLLVSCLGPPHSFFLTRKAVAAVGLFDPAVTPCEDWDYWLRTAMKGFTFVHVALPLVSYERSDDSASRNYLRMVYAAERMLDKTRSELSDPSLRLAHKKGRRFIRPCMFHISYSEAMGLDLRRGRFWTASHGLWKVLRQDPRTLWPALGVLTHHKRNMARGLTTLLCQPFRWLSGR